MGLPDSDLVSWVFHLLPGFVAAWIFYGFTAHPKKSPFERTVQALIFTGIIKALVIPLGWMFVAIGRDGKWAIGTWNEDEGFVVSVLVAVFLGVAFSAFANTSRLHDVLPDWITKKTSFPTEWYSAFCRDKCYIYLHVTGGRRLYGWPTEWPDSPDSGHFVIQDAAWVLDDNQWAKLVLVEKVVIRVTDVEMVEFEKPEYKWDYDRNEYRESEALLLKAMSEAKSKKRGTDEDGKSTDSSDGRLPGATTGAILSQRPAANDGEAPTS